MNVRSVAGVCFALGLVAGRAFGAGSEVSGGGNTVRCTAAADNAFIGLYALDYIVTYQGPDSDAALAPLPPGVDGPTATHASLARIGQLLTAKLPKLGQSFTAYAALTDNHTDFTQQRIWLEAPLVPADIKDQDFIFQPPANCVNRTDTDIDVIQTVVREPSAGIVKYYANAALMTELRSVRPMQASFLLVHEWLWDYFQPGQINDSRLVDRLLHDASLEALSPHDLWLSLTNLGMSPADIGPDPTGVVPAPVGRTKLVLGGDFGCLLHAGAVTCWGHDPAAAGVPQPALTNARDVVAGDRFVCAVDDGGLHCWGSMPTPPQFAGLPGPALMAAGGDSLCLVASTGHVQCAGAIMDGATLGPLPAHPQSLAVTDFAVCAVWIGQGGCFVGNVYTPFPASIAAPTAVVATNTEVCVSHSAGVSCYSKSSAASALVTIAGPVGSSVALGDTFMCTRPATGTVACKLLGTEGFPWAFLPDLPPGTAVVASNSFACALDAGVTCWGSDGQGQTDVPPALSHLDP